MGPVETLDAALTQHLQTIQRTAFHAPPGGGPEWDGLLRQYGIAPVDGAERAMIVSCMHLERGAVPAEFRMAMLGLVGWAAREVHGLRASGGPASPALAALEQRIGSLVATEVAAYERAIGVAAPAPAAAHAGPAPIVAASAPTGPSFGSIFANANATAKEVPWAGMTYKSVVNLNCVHCGGPQEQPADFMCKYCRRPIAGSIKPTV